MEAGLQLLVWEVHGEEGRRDREGVISPCMGHSRVHLLLWPKCWMSSCLDILHTPMLSDFSSPLMSLAKRQAQSHSKLGEGQMGGTPVTCWFHAESENP